MDVVALGDSALLVVVGTAWTPETGALVRRLEAAVVAAGGGFGRPIPGAASLLVPFDPLAFTPPDAAARLRSVLAAAPDEPALAVPAAAPAVVLPTRYGGADGPDLEGVAAARGLRPADVVDLHASVEYEVRFLGFAPGFAYLGTVPPALATPRRSTPRARVAAGSVGIADDQTCVYPLDSPGGWQIIGRTEAPVWDPRRDPPALLVPGARVRFVPLEA